MKAIAKKFSNETEEMFVVAFTSRPVLQVRPKDRNKNSMAFTFSDAVTRYGEGMQEEELGEAYRRAGAAFKGQLQQNFVVLHDRRIGGAPQWSKWSSSVVAGSSKRQREEVPKRSEPQRTWKKPQKTVK